MTTFQAGQTIALGDLGVPLGAELSAQGQIVPLRVCAEPLLLQADPLILMPPEGSIYEPATNTCRARVAGDPPAEPIPSVPPTIPAPAPDHDDDGTVWLVCEEDRS